MKTLDLDSQGPHSSIISFIPLLERGMLRNMQLGVLGPNKNPKILFVNQPSHTVISLSFSFSPSSTHNNKQKSGGQMLPGKEIEEERREKPY